MSSMAFQRFKKNYSYGDIAVAEKATNYFVKPQWEIYNSSEFSTLFSPGLR